VVSKRFASELCSYYRRVKSARDVYVEGPTDARVLNEIFVKIGRKDIVAYPVTSLDFDIAIEQEVKSNNRLQVLVVGTLLTTCASAATGKAVCVIDADTCHYCKRGLGDEQFIIATDYADLLTYFCTDKCLAKILNAALGMGVDASKFTLALVSALQEIFRVRIVNLENGWRCKHPDPWRSCSVVGGELQFDVEHYIRRLLAGNARLAELEAFREELSVVHIQGGLDYRSQMRGHDFVDILAYYLRREEPAMHHATHGAVEALLFLTHSESGIESSPMIEKIAQRLPRGSAGARDKEEAPV
jgi:hypothetical protein